MLNCRIKKIKVITSNWFWNFKRNSKYPIINIYHGFENQTGLASPTIDQWTSHSGPPLPPLVPSPPLPSPPLPFGPFDLSTGCRLLEPTIELINQMSRLVLTEPNNSTALLFFFPKSPTREPNLPLLPLLFHSKPKSPLIPNLPGPKAHLIPQLDYDSALFTSL